MGERDTGSGARTGCRHCRGGNAALCAAIEAAKTRASVLTLEGAPKAYRSGNSRHTRNLRCMHHGALGPQRRSRRHRGVEVRR